MIFNNETTAEKLRIWDNYLNDFKLPDWNDIPDFGLYMEQVIVLLKQYLDYLPPDIKEEQLITASTVNNYVRTKIMPEPIKKKYYRKHIAYLIVILTLKQSLSIALIKKVFPLELNDSEIESEYTAYVCRHKMAARYFTGQIKIMASPILEGTDCSEASADKTEDIIIMSSIFSGFSRLLAERLLLDDKNDDSKKDSEKDKAKDKKEKKEKNKDKEIKNES